MNISKRLTAVAKYINGYDSLADIACDHGYLGIYAAKHYFLKDILLTDINEMPLASAKENIRKYNLENIINTKLGNGLKPLEKAYDVISICGIGGILMTEILSNDLEKIKKAKRLILCPNIDSYNVRKFLNDNNFKIDFEEVIFDYKFYEIIVCSYQNEFQNYSELELKYGPCLLKEKSNDFIMLHEKQLKLLSTQLPNITNEEQKMKIIYKINEIKSILM